MCVFLLKQIVSHNVNKRTLMFADFLDAYKVFPRTNHNLLFTKLIERNVSTCIVRLLAIW